MRDAPRLRVLLDDWQVMLAKHAAESGSIEIIELLLAGHEDDQRIRQLMLESAANKGNVDVLQYLLQANPSIEVSDDVRSAALEGGVETWKALLTHSPGLIDRDFGEKGDLISMTALTNNVPLLTFFLEKGLDPNKSHFFTRSILDVVTGDVGTKQEIIDLLVEFGATPEKSAEANGAWKSR